MKISFPLHTKFSRPRVFKDPRLFQITALGSFLIFGILQLGWHQELLRIGATIAFTLLFQIIAIGFFKLPKDTWKSGCITALGLCLLFHTSEIWVIVLASATAVFSKYLIRWKGKHLFNPANIGIVIPLMITNEAWVSPGQWGSEAMLAFFFLSAASMVLMKVGRVDTSLTFLITLFALESLRSVLYLEWGIDVVFHKMMNGSILLFAFFMITDPRTTPNTQKGRIIWAALIALASFLLTSVFYLHTAPIWALFLSAPISAFINQIYGGRDFTWKTLSLSPNTSKQ